MRGQILSVTMRQVLWATQAREKTKPRDIEWFFLWKSKLSSAAEKNLPGYVFKSVLVFQKLIRLTCQDQPQPNIFKHDKF